MNVSKVRRREPVLANELHQQDVLLDVNWSRDRDLCVFGKFQILEFLEGPLVYERPGVVWDIPESGVSSNILEPSLFENG